MSNKFTINYIETHIVDHCNLNCSGCSHFSPLVKEKWFKDITEYESEMKRLSEIFNINTIRVMGGEPLLHPDFMQFLRITKKYFPNSYIILVTNGLLLNRLEEYLDEFNKNNFILCLSDYGLKYDEDVFSKIKNKQLDNKAELYNIGLDLNGSKIPEYEYSICDLARNKWLFFQNGFIYPCCIMANIKYFNKAFDNIIKIDEADIKIDIFKYSVEEILSFISRTHNCCRYCDINFRRKSYKNFTQSVGDINEWICQ